jgi:amidase
MRSLFVSGIVAAALVAALFASACTTKGDWLVIRDCEDCGLPQVAEQSISQLSEELAAGRTTSEALVKAYLDRIQLLDFHGPTLRSIISINPQAIEQARALDAERKAGHVRGPLHGIPILIKDNIETKELPTTAGSLALKDNMTGRDAPMAARLREAGAILLGKTNLSEWANFRSTRSISGWSAVGGLVKNPYALDRNACGSSAGSGAATAASLAAAAIGTETSGSIVCPSNANGLVGFKPTVGLVSRTHVVPISHTQDTPGPMARSVMDAALVLTVIAGSDGADLATAEADHHKLNYALGLNKDALRGKRLGVLKIGIGGTVETDELFEQAQKDLTAAGATLVEVKLPDGLAGGGGGIQITQVEFKADVAKYLAEAAPAVKSKTLSDLIAFNTANAGLEMPLFGQQIFEQSDRQPGLDDPGYLAQLEKGKRAAGPDGIDKMLKADNLDAIVFITAAPAWPSDPAGASRGAAVNSATGIAAAAGYPHLTVPMGLARGLPVGLSFIGTAWSDGNILAMGYAYEQASQRRKPPTYLPSLNEAPETAKAFAPAQLPSP